MIQRYLKTILTLLSSAVTLSFIIAAIKVLKLSAANAYWQLGMRSTVLFALSAEFSRALKSVFLTLSLIAAALIIVTALTKITHSFILKGESGVSRRVFYRVFALIFAGSIALTGFITVEAYVIGNRLFVLFSKKGLLLHALFIIAGIALFAALVWMFKRINYDVLKSFVIRVFSFNCILVIAGVIAVLSLTLNFIVKPSLAAKLSRGRPNVLLLVVDALRKDHLGMYNPTSSLTPALDDFASQSAVFARVTSQGACTINSAPAIFASVYASEHGFVNYKTEVSSRLLTIAEILREQGYRTVGISTNPHVTRAHNMAQGFADFVELNPGASAGDVNRIFRRWTEHNGSKPFFAMLWYMDVHAPFGAPGYYYENVLGVENDPVKREFLNAQWFSNALDSTGKTLIRELYRDGVGYIDYETGNLLEALKMSGQWENTMIIFTTDHGESFWEHEHLCGHSNSLYNELIETPLIIKFPASNPSGLVETRVNSIDIPPTIAETAGAAGKIPPDFHRGTSLTAPFGPDSPLNRRAYFFSELAHYSSPVSVVMKSVQNDHYKLVVTMQRGGKILNPPRVQLLDLRRGELELEMADSSAFAGIRDEMMTELTEWEQNLKPYYSREMKMSGREEKALREKLKALGYVK